MGRTCLFAYTGLIASFRHACEFLYNLARLLKLIRSEKNNVLILENFLYDEQKQFSKQKCRKCSYSGYTFSHFESRFPTRDCIPFVRSGLSQLVIRVKGQLVIRVKGH